MYTSPGWEPVIEVPTSSNGVSITGNTAHDIPDARPGWVVSGNTLVPLSYVPSGGSPIVAPVSPGEHPGTSPATRHGSGTRPGSTTGNASANTLVGGDGADTAARLRRQRHLRGQGDKDLLIGGTGSDIFDFDVASHSFGIVRDALRGGDGGASFDGAGGAAGDRIDVSTIDANTAVAGNQVFAWGGTGAGQMSAIEMGNTATLIRGNTDADSAFEFELVIEDARTAASAYTSVDFIL